MSIESKLFKEELKQLHIDVAELQGEVIENTAELTNLTIQKNELKIQNHNKGECLKAINNIINEDGIKSKRKLTAIKSLLENYFDELPF